MTIIHQNNPKNQYSLINADILTWAAGYTGEPFMAMFCDPPYHLTTPRRFGSPNSAPAKFGTDGAYQRASKGMMGQVWDGGDIAFRPETWAALSQHLHPGGFVLAFAGTRGYHRMACAMEDSGLILHPALIWVNLSGFPKATRIDTQVDKAAGVDGTKVKKIYGDGKEYHPTPGRTNPNPMDWTKKDEDRFTEYQPATPLAQTWAGHRYGLQALKPALEFIAVAQVPYEGRPVDCITRTGAGTWNIDGSRIETGEELGRPQSDQHFFNGLVNNGWNDNSTGKGRWPANLLLDESGAELLDRQSGESVSRHSERGPVKIWSDEIRGREGWEGESTERGYDDSGGASRMFFKSDWQYEILEQLENADPLRYEPKVSTTEREAGLDGLKNNHPTLKPISLCKYLSTLISPPDAYAPRRLLIPFSGAGSEMIGAILAGWEEVTGIEMTPAYIPIAKKRLAWWSQWPGWGQTDVDKILASLGDDVPTEQMSLFEAAR